MEPVLLGLAAPSAVNEAGNLLERTLRAAGEPFAAMLHAVAATLAPNAEANESASVTVDDLETYLQKLQMNLASRIEQVLASAGVELDEPVALRVSEIDGRVEVVGEHPHKALIESALADDEDLAGQFTEMIALRELLTVTDEAKEGITEVVPLGLADEEVVTAVFSMDGDSPKLEFN